MEEPITTKTAAAIVIIASSSSFILGILAHKSYQSSFLRFQTAAHIPPDLIKNRRTIKGLVVKVTDSDNFRMVHTPPGRVFLTRLLFKMNKLPLKESIHVRLAGIDAPESAAFGMPQQPGNKEAKKWLSNRVLGRVVMVETYKLDQYHRLVGMVEYRWWFGIKRNLSLDMVKSGHACMYKQAGAYYGSIEKQLLEAEKISQARRRGMWAQGKNVVLPSEHKKNHLR